MAGLLVLTLTLLYGCDDDDGSQGLDTQTTDDTNQPEYVDNDEDGFYTGCLNASGQLDEMCNGKPTDCNDDDPAINPLTEWCEDADGDTFGNPATLIQTCDAGPDFVRNDEDCDDTEARAYPGNTETCEDGIDNDCSGDYPECLLDDANVADADFIFKGSTTNGLLGHSLDGAGDLDGDGYDDYLIGNPDASLITNGKAFVFYGDPSIYSAYYTLTGENIGDMAGYQVAGGGDVNNDGNLDVLVSALKDDEGGTDAGAVYLINGPITADMNLSDADAKLYGENSNDKAGSAIAMVGDSDGDGYEELLIGANFYNGSGYYAYGKAYLVDGPVAVTLDLSLVAHATIEGSTAYDAAGSAVAGGNDINGDGTPDFVVGAYDNRDNGSIADPHSPERDAGAGKIGLFYGPASGNYTIDDADVVILGEAAGDRFGISVAMGNVNGDAYDDLLVGAFYESTNASTAGAAYLFLGPLTSGTIDLTTDSPDAKILGVEEDAHAGSAVGFVDVDNDGNDDILIGANGGGTDNASTFIGGAYLFYGPVSGTMNLTDADAVYEGENRLDYAGTSVSGIGDIDGDSFGDFMIGAPFSDRVATDGGASYLFLGTGE